MTLPIENLDSGAKAAKGSLSALEGEIEAVTSKLSALNRMQALAGLDKMADGPKKAMAILKMKQEDLLKRQAVENKAVEAANKVKKEAASKAEKIQADATKKAEENSRQQEAMFTSVASAAVSAGLAVASMGLKLAQAGAQFALQSARFKQDTTFAWTSMLGSGEAAKKTFGYALKIANTLGESVEDVAAQMKEAFKVGASQDQAEKMVQMVSDMKAMGNDGANIGQLTDLIKSMKKGEGLSAATLAPLLEINTDKTIEVLATKLPGITSKGEQRKKDVLARLGELKGQKGVEAFQDAFKAIAGKNKAGDKTAEFNDTTITGSLKKIGNMAKNLFTSLETSAVGTALVSALQKVAGLFDASTPAGAKFKMVLEQVGNIAARLFGKLDLDQAVAGFSTLVSVVGNVLPYFEALGGGLLDGLGSALGPLFSALGGASGEVKPMQMLVDALKGLGKAVGFVVGIGLQVVGVFAALGVAMTSGVLYGGAMALVAVFDGVVDAIGGVVDFVSETADEIFSPLTDAIGEVLGSWWAAAANLLEPFLAPLGELATELAVIGSDLMASASEVGSQLVAGLLEGITSKWQGLKDTLRNLAKGLGGVVREALIVRSPSKVFAEIGSFTVQGFTQGVEGEQDNAHEAVLSTVSPKLMGLGAGGPGGAGSGRSATVYNSIEINGASDPAAVRQAAEEGATAGTMRVFELLGLESGALGPAT